MSRLSDLHALSTRLIATSDLPSHLADVLRAVIELQGTDAGAIEIINPRTGDLEVITQHGLEHAVPAHLERAAVWRTTRDESLKTRERILIEDIETDPNFGQRPDAGLSGVSAIQFVPLFDRAGESLGVISIHFRKPHRPSEHDLLITDLYARHAADMIERHQSQEQLSVNEDRYRALVDTSPHAVWRMSANGEELLEVGGGAIRPHAVEKGPSDAWLIDRVHPDDREETLAVWRHAVATQSDYDRAHRSLAPDGKYRYVRVRGVPLFDRQGNIGEWIGTATDITEMQQTEAALRESEERYHTLFTSIDEGFCVLEMLFDASGAPVDYRFLEANPAFEGQTGLYNAVGRTARELVPELESHWFETYGKVALTGNPTRFVNGSVPMGRWFDVYAFRLGGEESRTVALLFNDITERKRVDDERVQLLDRERAAREAAVAAVRIREEFIAIASHELKTPLTSMKAAAQLLNRRLQPNSVVNERMKTLADHVLGETNRLEALIADLLDASQVQQGRLKLRREHVDLAELADHVLARWIDAPERTELHRLELDAPTPVEGMFDPVRMDRVLTNLIANALKYSPNGGVVRLVARRVEDHAELVVSDEGIGIPDEARQQLFEPFVRGGQEADGIDGVGLGLYISGQIVAQHGGTITVESTVGAGSRFLVQLPLSQDAQIAE